MIGDRIFWPLAGFQYVPSPKPPPSSRTCPERNLVSPQTIYDTTERFAWPASRPKRLAIAGPRNHLRRANCNALLSHIGIHDNNPRSSYIAHRPPPRVFAPYRRWRQTRCSLTSLAASRCHHTWYSTDGAEGRGGGTYSVRLTLCGRNLRSIDLGQTTSQVAHTSAVRNGRKSGMSSAAVQPSWTGSPHHGIWSSLRNARVYCVSFDVTSPLAICQRYIGKHRQSVYSAPQVFLSTNSSFCIPCTSCPQSSCCCWIEKKLQPYPPRRVALPVQPIYPIRSLQHPNKGRTDVTSILWVSGEGPLLQLHHAVPPPFT